MSPARPPGVRATTFLTTVAAGLAMLAFAPAATAAAATADDADLSGACVDGVTVVVDATELGGGIEVGCAPYPASGAEALTAAGFADTRDGAGLLCAIDALPDPCPAEFTGVYWSYWFAGESGDWEMYMEGPDTSAPAAGDVEGWRYGDGTAGPSLTPAELEAAAAGQAQVEAQEAADAQAEAAQGGVDTGEDAGTPVEDDADGTPAWVVAAVGIAGVGAVAALVVGLLRRQRDLHGPAGQD